MMPGFGGVDEETANMYADDLQAQGNAHGHAVTPQRSAAQEKQQRCLHCWLHSMFAASVFTSCLQVLALTYGIPCTLSEAYEQAGERKRGVARMAAGPEDQGQHEDEEANTVNAKICR